MNDPVVFWLLAAAFLLLVFAFIGGVIIQQSRPATVLAVLAGLCAFGAAVRSLPHPPQVKGNGGKTHAQSMREGKISMNIETIDVASLRLPRTPRRPIGQRDNRWIEEVMGEIGAEAVMSVAAPDRLTVANDPIVYNGRRLAA